MPEDDTDNNETLKTTADLDIEQLKVRLDRIEDEYRAKLNHAEEVNRDLWAKLHPEQSSTPTVSDTQPSDGSEFVKAFWGVLGKPDREKKGE